MMYNIVLLPSSYLYSFESKWEEQRNGGEAEEGRSS